MIRRLRPQLLNNFGARVDNISRIYTVLNIPADLIEEPYNIRKSDIDNISRNFIKEYTNQLSSFLDNNGLRELYDFYEVEKVDKYSYLLVFGYNLFNTKKVARSLIFICIPVILVTSLILWMII